MVALIAFAFVAGAATALSPCVLPVLPVALSAGVTGGRRRPLGVVTGLAASFAFATVALVYVIDALGLPDSLVRDVAIVVLLVFGIALAVPALSARIEAAIGRVLPRPKALRAGDDGFGSGLAPRGEPRPRLRALRGADPRRGHHRLRLAGLHRRAAGRWRSPTRSAARPCSTC